MPRFLRNLITFCLLTAFAVLLLKNLIPVSAEGPENCSEFAHIHRHFAFAESESALTTWHGADHRETSPVGDCHGSQSLFSGLMLPLKTFEVSLYVPKFKIAEFPTENVDEPSSRTIEPQKRPPRLI